MGKLYRAATYFGVLRLHFDSLAINFADFSQTYYLPSHDVYAPMEAMTSDLCCVGKRKRLP